MQNIFSSLTDGDLKRIAAVIIIILANFVFAVVGALVKGGFDPAQGGFDWNKLPEFFYKQILPYVIGLAFFEAYLHIVPPSEAAQLLFGGPKLLADGVTISTANSWTWIDPTLLWTVYSAMVAMLVKQLSVNLFFLFGRGLDAAQAIAKVPPKS